MHRVSALMLGIVVALRWELKTLTSQPVPLGTCKPIGHDAIIALSGIGAQRAHRAATLLVSRGATALLSWGCAAALNDDLSAGSLLLPNHVIDVAGETHRTNVQWHRRLYNEIAGQYAVRTEGLAESAGLLKTANEKRALSRQTGAIAADMESAALARAAQEQRLPFMMVRAVIDSRATALPENLLDAINSQGEISLGNFLQHVVLHPQDWFDVIKLGVQFTLVRRTLQRISPVVLNCSRDYLNSLAT
jgi:adenosylhomocysteine nucleosidase